MTPTISNLSAQAYIDDLHRDSRRRHRYEEARRQLIRFAPPRHAVRRSRAAGVPTHH